MRAMARFWGWLVSYAEQLCFLAYLLLQLCGWWWGAFAGVEGRARATR